MILTEKKFPKIKQLYAKNANKRVAGNITVYSFEELTDPRESHKFEILEIPGTPISGGLEIKDSGRLYLSETCPLGNDGWKIGCYNSDEFQLNIVIHAIAMN
jgi:hypothetical protein